jgi:hypothetical protein
MKRVEKNVLLPWNRYIQLCKKDDKNEVKTDKTDESDECETIMDKDIEEEIENETNNDQLSNESNKDQVSKEDEHVLSLNGKAESAEIIFPSNHTVCSSTIENIDNTFVKSKKKIKKNPKWIHLNMH